MAGDAVASKIQLNLKASNDGSRNTFFTNTHLYVSLRLLEVMYTRLLKFRNISNQLATEGPQSKAPLIVTGLSPQATAFIESMGDPNANASHFYELMLESCERVFDNEVEQAAFEEQMRLMFGVKKIFTNDKLIGSIIKQVQVILADSKSQELLETLKRDRSIPSFTTQDYLNSQHNAEKVLGPDENLFRIDWAYTKSYAQTGPTTDVHQTKIRRPFLRKNLPTTIPTEANIKTSDGLKIKVCVRTYRLFFVSDSEDYLPIFIPSSDSSRPLTQAYLKKWREWLGDIDVREKRKEENAYHEREREIIIQETEGLRREVEADRQETERRR
ncbi:uncharacterized protein EV420DRAFT_1646964 [Desarmillaria tabescens]|uniref:Sin3 C-terminal domain-containing protein n=1 Tax=Armillaria tabescens TaxID=1929756 RepID=A0AA39MXN1_ARMTA|nr:uncharacterized protein EV420DRAFT_1646964 [Desarmillaria tabescens]KAK0449645.1 hypothetical protein EV420DRAFT_1646964 [Desarmillaria tabescens]